MQITFNFDIYNGLTLSIAKISTDSLRVVRSSQFETKKGKTMFSYEVELINKNDKVRISVLSLKSEFPTSGDIDLRLLSCEGYRGIYQMKYWLS